MELKTPLVSGVVSRKLITQRGGVESSDLTIQVIVEIEAD